VTAVKRISIIEAPVVGPDVGTLDGVEGTEATRISSDVALSTPSF